MKSLLLFLFCSLLLFSCKKNNDNLPPPAPEPATPKVPILVTNPVDSLTLFSVKISGKLTDTGGSKVTEIGFVVDTLPLPTTTRNANKFKKQPDNNGEFSSKIIEIPASKNWYVRAYAINAQGVGYGNEITFKSLQDRVFLGSVVLNTQQEVNAFGANEYTTITGGITISGPMTDLKPLRTLVIIGSGMNINSTQLTDLTGLENLEIIGNRIPHSFRIERNQSLKNFVGLKNLKIVSGDFYIINNDALVDLTGLESFTTSATLEFRIDNCDQLTSINGVEKMQAILGGIMIKDNPLLKDLSAWNNLETVSGRISIINNSSLQILDGFEKVKSAEGLELVNNRLLIGLKGIRNIQNVNVMILDNNDALTDFSGFHNLATAVHINIKNNDILSNLEGFKNLQSLQSQLVIENNPALTNLKGFSRLKSLGRLELHFNNSLLNLDGLDSLTSIRHTGYSIGISSNRQLQNLNGLKSVTTAAGSIQIEANPSLIDFCGLKPLFMAGYNDWFSAQRNSANPTKTDIMTLCP